MTIRSQTGLDGHFVNGLLLGAYVTITLPINVVTLQK